MKDILQDIVTHTHNLGFLNIVKVTGEDTATKIDSIAEDRTVILSAETHNPYADMVGTFGMPQLNKLKYLLDGAEYKEDSKIEIVREDRNGETIPTGIHFENKDGDFKNDYRFMNVAQINEKLKTVKFKGVKWDVTIQPSLQAVQRFAFQAGANNEHTTFTAKTDGDKLKFTFGDISSHAGEFVFATGVSGKLSKAWAWPVSQVLSILKIADVGNATMSLSDGGALQITIDSGLVKYEYIIPAGA
jgi:hypothetical protein